MVLLRLAVLAALLWMGSTRADLDFQVPQYVVRVPEDAPVGTTLVKVQAWSSEGGLEVRYGLQDACDKRTFTLDSRSGLLVLAGLLDREAWSSCMLHVTATDPRSGERARARVLVQVEDVNDNAPVFLHSQLQLRAPRDTPPGTLLHRFGAKDQDVGRNAELTYSLAGDKAALSHLRLDPKSGSLLLARSLADLAPLPTALVFRVQATDRGFVPLTGSVEVRLMVPPPSASSSSPLVG